MNYARHIRNKIRYNGVLGLFLDAVSKIGVKIVLYYSMLDRLDADRQMSIMKGFEDYEVGYLKDDDMKEMANIPFRTTSDTESQLIQRLEKGMKCFGVKHKCRLVAFAWYGLDYGELPGYFYPLKPDEAYLFDVVTAIDYRGKGLASYLSCHLFNALRSEGKTKLLSYTSVFNIPYIRSRMKLDTQITEKGFFLILFGRLLYHKVLKTYRH
jgi:hypothetical protein